MVFPVFLIPVVVILAYLAVFFGFGAIATLIPALGLTLVGAGMIVLAWFLPSEALQYKKGNFAISAKGIFAIIGAGILLINFFGIGFTQFLQGLSSGIGLSAGANPLTIASGQATATPTIAIIVIGAIAVLLLIDKKLRKKLLGK